MSEKLHGVVRGGVIELDAPINLPDGTEVEITVVEESYRNAWKRQKDLMRRGFPMGQRQNIQREDLYERG
ncbi:hypothetical protein ACFL6S_21535 [Candidatus Poribacteria bacterium]